jgi:endoglucanase
VIVTILIIGLSIYAVDNLVARNETPKQTTTTSTSASSYSDTMSSLSIRVVGNKLVDGSGNPVHLIGVNVIAGDCVPGQHDSNLAILYDGGLSNAALAEAISQWHANVVRITPNEDCWLGINGVNASVSGANYRDGIKNFVFLLNNLGIYVIIDLHASAPGSYLAIGEQPMADQDHSIAYWQSVATMFKNDSAVIFEPYNEPHITSSNAETIDPWKCWLDGCNITIVQGYDGQIRANNTSWQAAGMQELVDTIRSTGATNPILIGGLNWSQNLTGLLNYLPNDPLHELIANYHNYDGPLNNQNYWNTVIASVAQQMPLITSEFGENDCGTSFVSQYMSWADSHNISYLPWAWTNWQCSAYGLLSNWNGTPSAYGQVFYTHFHSINP